MIGDQFGNPEFWMALVVGAGAVAIFLYWLLTGGRRRRPTGGFHVERRE
jgi:hypothetical protein